MNLRSIAFQTVGILFLGLCGFSGCGGSLSDTGPTEQPNIGPGVPAGSPTFAAKSDTKAPTSASNASRNATK
ncbi:hypothetical protein V5E97_38565 [Singulisphaera sp. Ch08]|uniref:Uncharacterized protein n=1 Tax=Singulisphaera sp. Ch08 TaxID=3120278 RepID=A0AAU7CGT6_9BACT